MCFCIFVFVILHLLNDIYWKSCLFVTGFLTNCCSNVSFFFNTLIHTWNSEREPPTHPPRPDRPERSLIRKASGQWRLCAGAPAKLQVVTGSDGSLTLWAAVFITVYSALRLAKVNRVPWLLEGKVLTVSILLSRLRAENATEPQSPEDSESGRATGREAAPQWHSSWFPLR